MVYVLNDLVRLLLGRRRRPQEDRRVPARNRRHVSEQRLDIRVLCGAEDAVLDTLGGEAEAGMETEPKV